MNPLDAVKELAGNILYFPDYNYSRKALSVVWQATQDAYPLTGFHSPWDSPQSKYLDAYCNGLAHGGAEIYRALTRRLEFQLYPYGFTEPQVAVVATMAYDGSLPLDDILDAAFHISVPRFWTGLLFDDVPGIPIGQLQQAYHELVANGIVIEKGKKSRLSWKIDEFL